VVENLLLKIPVSLSCCEKNRKRLFLSLTEWMRVTREEKKKGEEQGFLLKAHLFYVHRRTGALGNRHASVLRKKQSRSGKKSLHEGTRIKEKEPGPVGTKRKWIDAASGGGASVSRQEKTRSSPSMVLRGERGEKKAYLGPGRKGRREGRTFSKRGKLLLQI